MKNWRDYLLPEDATIHDAIAFLGKISVFASLKVVSDHVGQGLSETHVWTLASGQ